MGKKKAVKKTKELSVAIAESSSLDAEGQQQQPLTPRKRGRPRKIIVEKAEAAGEVKEEETAQEGHGDDIEGSQSKKVEISTAEEEGKEEKGQPKMKEEGTTTSSTKKQVPTKSRARRKSKPMKSS